MRAQLTSLNLTAHRLARLQLWLRMRRMRSSSCSAWWTWSRSARLQLVSLSLDPSELRSSVAGWLAIGAAQRYTRLAPSRSIEQRHRDERERQRCTGGRCSRRLQLVVVCSRLSVSSSGGRTKPRVGRGDRPATRPASTSATRRLVGEDPTRVNSAWRRTASGDHRLVDGCNEIHQIVDVVAELRTTRTRRRSS